MSGLKKFVLTLFILVIVLPLGTFAFMSFSFGDMYNKNIDTSDMDSITHSNTDGIYNILITGSDARPGEEVSRTDSMMILTIDKVHDDIKLTSLARDSFVKIPGHGYSKLTHAFAFGKEKLLIQTIENNFDIDINEYVNLNFESFMAIIDSLDGVEVQVTQNEINELNKFIPETYSWSKEKKEGKPMELVKNTGKQVLNGYQALSFARIRHNDSAFGRDDRQRQIMQSMLNKITHTSKLKYPFILKEATPYITTSMKTTDILKYGLMVVSIGTDNIKKMEFPIVSPEGYSKGGIYGGYGWVLRFDESTVSILKDFIYQDKEFGK